MNPGYWQGIHRTIGATGGVTIDTGYWEYFDSVDGSGDGVSITGPNATTVYTSPLTFPIRGDLVIFIKPSAAFNGTDDIFFTWSMSHNATPENISKGTDVWKTTGIGQVDDASGADEDLHNISSIDVSAHANAYEEAATGFWCLYDYDTVGKAKFNRIGILAASNESDLTIGIKIFQATE